MELIRTSFNLYIFLHNTRGGTGNNLRNTVFDAGESTHTALKFFFKGILLFEFFLSFRFLILFQLKTYTYI